MTIAVAQLGARMNYAVPRIAARHNLLHTFYTDFYGGKAPFNWLRHVPMVPERSSMHKLTTRRHPSLSTRSVVHFPGFGLTYPCRRDRCRTQEEQLKNAIDGGRQFNRRVTQCLQKQPLPDMLYTFSGAGLELLRFAKERGIRTIHEQTIVNHRVERDLLRREQERFPAWQQTGTFGPCSDASIEREEEEQALADRIVCGSSFVKQHSNRPADTYVIPYGVDGNATAVRLTERDRNRPLRVLVVGYVNLRKGCEYTLEAARQLTGRATFRLVGDFGMVPERVLTGFRKHTELIGVIPRARVADHYRWADVLLLPSVCEGSATVTYEALQHGLPQIVTPNAGSLIRHGEDGFVVPVGDAASIVMYLDKLAGDESLRLSMARRASETARLADYDAYADRLGQFLMAQ